MSTEELDHNEKVETTNELQRVASFTKDNIGGDNIITTIDSGDGRVIKVTGDVDEAMELAIDNEGVVLDAEEDKKLLRKIDLYLLPLICLLYAFQFMDKTTLSYAAVMGLRTDFKMTGDQYSWCGSAFYLGYLIFVFPANALIQRFPLAKTTAIFIALWGVILCLHAAAGSYAGFVTLRVLLGILESAVTPAMVLITSAWYKKEEQFLRTAIWFSCNGLGTIIGGGIAYGIADNEANFSITAWKALFIITGVITIVLGAVFYLHIPDIPSKAWFLSEHEKRLVVERIRSNQQGFGNRHFKLYQFKEALGDVNTWLFFLFAVAGMIPNGATTNFGSILLNSDFGYTAKQSLLMNMPGGAVEFVGCILLASFNKFIPHRLAICVFAEVVALASSCMLAFAGPKNVRLAGYYLMNVGPITMISALSLFASNAAGHTKKITTNAVYLIAYCAGNVAGPQTFIAKQAPSYTGGKISFVVCDAFQVLIILAIYLSYYLGNKRKEKKESSAANALKEIENYEFADLTDKENPFFRYSL
ncbi:DEKNAAC102248 [Brettanomyces naardenensis]|uniref:DEKNAAC102249 n=1 Tax=Brettanomyces naardenensis TaxID=13370 RepID=A0A448YKF8_BRENA|nr:DEKNAAC102248 [Brettanomyces naardenensis]